MKNVCIALALVVLGISGAVSAGELSRPALPRPDLRVLFLGNSYTASGVSGMLDDLASAAGLDVRTAVIAPGGWRIEDHVASATSMDAVRQGDWDVVVVQEQSTRPIFFLPSFLQSAHDIAQVIRSAQARPVFFETWARRWDHSIYDSDAPHLPDTPAEMQAQLRSAYLLATARCADWLTPPGQRIARQPPWQAARVVPPPTCRMAPVGDAWEEALRLDPSLPLHTGDGSHPTTHGTYLAALVFFAVLLDGEESEVAWKPLAISEADATTLREAAFLGI